MARSDSHAHVVGPLLLLSGLLTFFAPALFAQESANEEGPVLIAPDDAQRWTLSLRSFWPEERRRALWELGRRSPAIQERITFLAKILSENRDLKENLWETAWALSRLGPTAVPILQGWLHGREPAQRRAAAYALLQQAPHNPAALSLLLRLDPSADRFLESLKKKAVQIPRTCPAATLAGWLKSDDDLLLHLALNELHTRGPRAAAAGPAFLDFLLTEQRIPGTRGVSILLALQPALQLSPDEFASILKRLRADLDTLSMFRNNDCPLDLANAALLSYAVPRDLTANVDSGQTEEALSALSRLNRTVPPEVVAWLHDPQPERRAVALRALLAFGHEAEGFTEHLKAFRDDPFPELRDLASQTHAQIFHARKSIPHRIRQELSAEPNPTLRQQRLDALAHLGPEAESQVVEFLSDSYPELRIGMARGLARVGAEWQPRASELVPRLILLLENGGAEATAAAEALAGLGPAASAAIPALLADLQFDRARHTPERRTKWAALLALGPRDPRVLAAREASREAGRTLPRGDEVLEIVLDSGQYTDQDIRDFLGDATWIPGDEIRWQFLAPRVAPQILKALRDPRPNVRRLAAQVSRFVLPAIHPEFCDPLALRLLDEDATIADAAAEALPHWERAAVPALLKVLENTSPAAEERILACLEQLGSQTAGAENAIRKIAPSLSETGRTRIERLTLRMIEPPEGFDSSVLPDLIDQALLDPQQADFGHLAQLGPPAGPTLVWLLTRASPEQSLRILRAMRARVQTFSGCWEDLRPRLEAWHDGSPAGLTDAHRALLRDVLDL